MGSSMSPFLSVMAYESPLQLAESSGVENVSDRW